MSSAIFLSRIRGLPVLDAAGDQVGKVRDVVVQVGVAGRAPRAKGLVVSLFARHPIFVPMGRVQMFSAQQVVISGVVDTRKFSRRMQETLVFDDLVDREVTLIDGTRPTIADVAMQPVRSYDWEVSEVAVSSGRKGLRRRPHLTIIPWSDVANFSLSSQQDTATLVAQMEEMKPADVARELHDLTPERRAEVAGALADELLADALEELPEAEQVSLISALDADRAADILEEMDPDDAADLIADLAPAKAADLLDRMDADDAADVRLLLTYAEFTAGGMMTPEPVVLAPDATVADALARLREAHLTPALACTAFVCRPPLEAPTGRYLGGAHIQRLLREPPSTLVSACLDGALEPLPTDATVADVSRYFATYNLVVVPVIDGEHRLVGAVTVDDLLDHMLPDDWRGKQMAGPPNDGDPT